MSRPVRHSSPSPRRSQPLLARSGATRKHHLWGALVLAALSPTLVALPAPSQAKTTDTRPVIAKGPTKTADRISMPKRDLPPSIIGKRALGSTFLDRVNVAFTAAAGNTNLGIVRGVIDLATSDADLQYLPPPEAAASGGTTGPFTLRIRNSRIQVGFPQELKLSEGVDGYVTTIDEGSYAGVGTENEVLLPIAIITSLELPFSVAKWTKAKASASSTGTVLTGSAERTSFKLFPSNRFGTTAGVDLQVKPNGTVGLLTVRFSPVAEAKKSGARVIELRGTVVSSTKTLAEKAPTGTFVTAAKYFDLEPLPEFDRSPDAEAAGA